MGHPVQNIFFCLIKKIFLQTLVEIILRYKKNSLSLFIKLTRAIAEKPRNTNYLYQLVIQSFCERVKENKYFLKIKRNRFMTAFDFKQLSASISEVPSDINNMKACKVYHAKITQLYCITECPKINRKSILHLLYR